MENERKDMMLRLRRIEGQVRGLQGMIEREAPCTEILTQVGAVTAAMKKVGAMIMQTHMEECLQVAAQQPVSGEKPGEMVRDFRKALSRFMSWA
jgi:DNA-binding FrmR family transcriptional regulator